MKLHKIIQGSDAWHELRSENLTASDAPAMMGDSKYKSRNQLLHEKKTGRVPEVSAVQQKIFDEGHRTEALARELIELEMLEDFSPAVGTKTVEGLPLLASLDGYSGEVIFEHKQWNEILAENVRNNVLEPAYYWQLEHQLLVFGADNVLFVVSDGTEKKREQMVYFSKPERREALIAGWKQFAKDLETYEPEAKQEAVVAHDVEAFPLVTYEVRGSEVLSNIADVLPIIQQRADQEMNRVLETDQDFADKEKLNKEVKQARAKLKQSVEDARSEFISLAEFYSVAGEVDAILQRMWAHGDKQVKEAKARKKEEIVAEVESRLINYLGECNSKIAPLKIEQIIEVSPDWTGAMKGKRNLESIRDAVDGVLANAKIEVDQAMARIVPNQIYLKERAKDYVFLFADVAQIINQEVEPFQAVVTARIDAHVKAEEKRLEAQREQIRQEEERKAQEKVRRDEEERVEAQRQKEEQKNDHVVAANKKVEPVQEMSQAVDDAPVTPLVESMERVVPSAVEEEMDEIDAIFYELSAWVEQYAIPQPAVVALGDILQKHGVVPAQLLAANG